MTLTRSQINAWNPATLSDVADAWIHVGTTVEDLFTRYVDAVTRVGDSYWEGATAEAAQNRANADRKTAVVVVDALEALADRARQGFHEVEAPLSRARTAIMEAEAEQFSVSDELSVTDLVHGPSPERDTARAEWQEYIRTAAQDAARADEAVRADLAAARDGLRATFTSAATLGADQGRSDAAALTNNPGDLSPEAVQRLVEAGELSPEQLSSLSEGAATTVPASHMEYLNQISRSLDGKSPSEIEEIFEQLPPDARTGLANSLQLVSNPNITASVEGDAEVPTHGGIELLPDQIRQSLERDDLVVREMKIGSGYPLPSVELNGVADNQAVARIAGAADSDYKAGSDLNTGLMEVGRQYLDAQVAHEQNPDHKFEYFTVDGRGGENPAVTEEIFAAVGDDKIAVQQAFTDPDHGKDFVSDLFTKNWTDDGSAASTLFRFDDADAFVENPDDPRDVARATRTGEIMSAVAESVSTDQAWQLMSNVPESGGQSVGDLNPELLRTVSESMSPYASDLAGADPADRPGFDLARRGEDGEVTRWADPHSNSTMAGSVRVVSLLNTDEQAGALFNSAAMGEILAQEGMYAAEPAGPNSGSHLATAGKLMALVDSGAENALQSRYDNDADRAQAVYDRKSSAYEALTGLGTLGIGKLPGGEYINQMVGLSGDSLKDSLIGTRPGEAPTAVVQTPDYSAHYHAILMQSPELPESYREAHPWAFDVDGSLRQYHEVQDESLDSLSLVGSGYATMFSGLGNHSVLTLESEYNRVRNER
ncbi:hypothetical protein G4H71_15375 [Rhodococcus triatomae]|uniref:TPR repeat domain-containing protein n=1 Tax=Rhodococcus triatomae TaxID=300028 RepID=A0A1G8J055_9NOCA|nr:hypothetical protein [Rhodococcus triatomae]QNG19854.1 hypothetical protein G4H72_14995 [Rhodococcus triatomae]QNG24230.1 hypothetical protein G4H71_15375 [Rhodococcus triatomae]SDI24589.1 hypothetical protein SAMN05444695_10621 [Rhodococcus triatomae]